MSQRSKNEPSGNRSYSKQREQSESQLRLKAAVAIAGLTLSLLVVATVQAIDAGTYRVGSDIQPGIYVGNPRMEIGDSCYWARLSGLSGGLDDITANGNARGQFYVEVKSTDSYFTVRCEVTPLAEWPVPPQLLSEIGTGMYIVGRDIAAGIYAGNPGSEAGDSCYWARLSGASGEFDDITANGNEPRQPFCPPVASPENVTELFAASN